MVQIASRSEWRPAAIEQLINVVQDLSHARNLGQIMEIVRHAARELTGADGATFVLRDGDFCHYAEEDAVSPLWKGQRFPLSTCISGWVMLNAQSAVIEDIYADPRIPADAYRPTFVKSLAMVPIRKEKPIGAIGNYWAQKRQPSEQEVALLEALANVTSVAVENADLYSKLQEKIHALEISNDELNRFAWIASHDLKSPLRAIDNLSNWLEDDLKNKDFQKSSEHLQTIHTRVKRMEKLLDDVLEYARLSSASSSDTPEYVIGANLLNDIMDLLYIPAGFNITASERFKILSLQRMPLQQVFANLINNSLTHHDKKSGLVEIDVSENDTTYDFSVSDDGPGIDPKYYKKIFEMFQTLQPRDIKEGSGMGLALVKKTLDLHGGLIKVEARKPRGTIFRFTWPKKLQFKS